MCKEMPVIPVNKVVDPKRIIVKKRRAEEEERHKESLTQRSGILKLAWVDARVGQAHDVAQARVEVTARPDQRIHHFWIGFGEKGANVK
jgi:hypothetical protein